MHKYRKNFKSSISFSIGGKVGGKWTCDYSGSLVWWDDQQQVIGSCQQISCMEGPNLLLPFFGQDSFFNVLNSFHFTIQNRELCGFILFLETMERTTGSLRLWFEDATVVHRR